MKRAGTTLLTSRNIALLAVLVALVVVLQLWGGSIRIGATSLSFVLIPIVLGGILIGAWAGALLGLIFGFIVLMGGVSGTDPFTAILLAEQPVLTVLLCLVKGVAAGYGAGILYKLISKKNKLVAAYAASIIAPILNTGIFILGGLLMSGTLVANFVADGESVIYFLVVGCAGMNFILEFALSVALSPAIYTVTNTVIKQFRVKKKKNDNLS